MIPNYIKYRNSGHCQKIRQAFKKEYKKYQRKPANIELLAELKQKEEALPKIKIDASALYGWQKLVFEHLPSGIFKTSDIYLFEEEFRKHYPENVNIQAKIRQILQQLRDFGTIFDIISNSKPQPQVSPLSFSHCS